MAVIDIQTVLNRAAEFERLLVDYYSHVASRTTRDGVRLLADFISRHRARIHDILDKLPPQVAARIRATPLRFDTHAADCHCFEGVELPPEASAAQVLDAAVRFDECLVRLYRQVLEQPLDEEARELFERLVEAEQRDEIELKKIKALDYF